MGTMTNDHSPPPAVGAAPSASAAFRAAIAKPSLTARTACRRVGGILSFLLSAAPNASGAADSPLVKGGQGRLRDEVIESAERFLVLPAVWRGLTEHNGDRS